MLFVEGFHRVGFHILKFSKVFMLLICAFEMASGANENQWFGKSTIALKRDLFN